MKNLDMLLPWLKFRWRYSAVRHHLLKATRGYGGFTGTARPRHTLAGYAASRRPE